MTSTLSCPVALADVLDIVDTAVITVSRRLPLHVSRDDLASVGKIALVQAFAQCHGSIEEVRAYCFVRVRGAMLDELRRLDPLSRGQRERANAIARTQASLNARLGRVPTVAEVAQAAGLTVSMVNATAAAHRATEPTEVEWDTLQDPDAACPAERAANDDLRATLVAALQRLPPNQAFALRRYYLEDATLDAIAAELGVSRERARQIREAGEKKLRSDLVILSLWQTLFVRS